MTLDFTVIVAQIVNFLVLVWLLQRFLYRPVKNMIRSREEQMRRRMEDVLAREAEAQQAQATYQRLQAELERERAQLLEQAREEARRERSRLLEAAADEARQLRSQLAEALETERRELASSLQESLVRQVCDTSERVLSLLGGVTLADAIISTLEERWHQREGSDNSSPGVAEERALVRSSFPLTPDQRARLTALVARMRGRAARRGSTSGLAPDGDGLPEVEFQVDPALVLGVEVEMGGQVMAWSARGILEDLQREALASLTPLADAPLMNTPGAPSQRGEVSSHA